MPGATLKRSLTIREYAVGKRMTGQNNWDNWNVVEKPQERNRWIVGLLIGALAVCLLAACAIGGYYFLLPALAEPTLPPVPAVPTVPGAPETATAVVQATDAAGGAVTTVPVTATEAPPAATVTVETTTEATLPATGQVVAVRAASPPAIDGSLDEYAEAPAVPSAFRVYSAGGWDGSSDLDATWRLLWDEQYLYVGATVVDDVHVQTQTGNQIYRGDSLDMQIDTAPLANASQVNPETYQIILSPGNFGSLGESAFRFQGTESGRLVDAPGHHVDVQAQQTAEGYTLEAAIPWSDLDVNPAAGTPLGLALNANDNDQPGAAIQEVMMSHVSTRTLTNPRSWGTLTLE